MSNSIVWYVLRAVAIVGAAMFLRAPAHAQGPVQQPNPTVGPLPCAMILYKPPVSIFGSGVDLSSLPTLKFVFQVYAPVCTVNNVKVNWAYQTASKATQTIVSTKFGTKTFKVLPAGQVQIWELPCTPNGPYTYCRDASATIVQANNYYIEGNATATLGPEPVP
jgi:hypothetical protein